MFRLLDFLTKFLRRDTVGAISQNNQLLHPIRGRHTDTVLPAQCAGGLFDVRVRRLRSLGIDHINVVHVLDLPLHAVDTIGIEHQNQVALPIALIVAQDSDQPASGSVQTLLRQRFQLVPRKNDVVPIHQQILLPTLLRGDLGKRRRHLFQLGCPTE